MAAKYRFKTVMVSDYTRSAFTRMRDSYDFKVTDKELFDAIFYLADKDTVAQSLLLAKKEREENKEREKIAKLESQLKEKLEKLESVKETQSNKVLATK